MLQVTQRLPTRSFFDRLSRVILASPSFHIKHATLKPLIEKHLVSDGIHSNIINSVVYRWAHEQPTKQALCINDNQNPQQKQSTFEYIHQQSCRWANVFTKGDFSLTYGQTVFVVLPPTAEERILLLLACLQKGLVFCSYDPKYLTKADFLQRLRKLAVECIITNEDYMDEINSYTQFPLRPLKRGFLAKSSAVQIPSVGWYNLNQLMNAVDHKFTKENDVNQDTIAIRLLSDNENVLQYTQEACDLRFLFASFWLNSNHMSRLTWMKHESELMLMAPWFFGSNVFLKEASDSQTILDTLKNHPIDTLCSTARTYQLLNDTKSSKIKTNLEQLLSLEPVDANIKDRWRSLTNLSICDDYLDFHSKMMSQYSSKHSKGS